MPERREGSQLPNQMSFTSLPRPRLEEQRRMQGKGSSPNATHKRAKTLKTHFKKTTLQHDTLKQASGCIRSNILQRCSECSYLFSINTVFVRSGCVWICGLDSDFEWLRALYKGSTPLAGHWYGSAAGVCAWCSCWLVRAELRLTKAHVTSPLATLGFFWASSIFRANRVEYRSMMPLQLSADADEFLYHSWHTKPIAHEESFNTQIMHTVSYSSLLVKCSRICISAGNVLMYLRPFVCQSITQPHMAKSEIVYHTVQCLFINQSINLPYHIMLYLSSDLTECIMIGIMYTFWRLAFAQNQRPGLLRKCLATYW